MNRNTFWMSLMAVSFLAVSALPPGTALAQDAAVEDHYTLSVGICGYSPVSYFTVGRAEPGSAAFTAEHDGVTYFFTSAEQVETFTADPGAYVPAYGGWCAFGMSVEDHFTIDPESFKIVGGRLMLFLNNDEVDARALWNEADAREVKAKADRFWKATHGQ